MTSGTCQGNVLFIQPQRQVVLLAHADPEPFRDILQHVGVSTYFEGIEHRESYLYCIWDVENLVHEELVRGLHDVSE